MKLHGYFGKLIPFAAVAPLLVLIAVPAEARLFRASVAAVSAGARNVSAVAVDAQAGPAVPLCCPQPCISYRYHGCFRQDCDSPPPIRTVLLVKNPQSCEDCYVEVPVCIPVCSMGEPCVSSRCGLFGRGIVTYEYESGFSIQVVFRARGDVVVHYRGG